jgi:hypothetical protein
VKHLVLLVVRTVRWNQYFLFRSGGDWMLQWRACVCASFRGVTARLRAVPARIAARKATASDKRGASVGDVETSSIISACETAWQNYPRGAVEEEALWKILTARSFTPSALCS